ncbi:MAG: phosphatidylinositol kinase, partial [Candidatus Nanopelagicales bacterium]
MASERLAAGTPELSHEAALRLLREGEIDVVGRLVDASNATLFCGIESVGSAARCIYKPRAGERPLWDFPSGTLSLREVAAYEVSQALGWGIVPPTLWRDGPFGEGMVQLWIDVDESVDLVGLVHGKSQQLRRIAVFDVVINNADR